MKLTWLADVLRKAGLKVIEEPGWKTRGVGGKDMKRIAGILCHHTACGLKGNAPSLRIVVDGDASLRGPRGHLVLARDGTYHVVAAGKANHAGEGAWKPLGLDDDGNTTLIGIEAENTGRTEGPLKDPWPPRQVEAYEIGCAAMLQHLGLPASAVIGHKEYAPKRKIDPTFDMPDFRKRVAGRMKTDLVA